MIRAQKKQQPVTCFSKLAPRDNYFFTSLRKKATTHQVTTMLATSKNVLFPGDNHLLTTSTDDLTGAQAINRVLGHQYRWFAGGYDLEIEHF